MFSDKLEDHCKTTSWFTRQQGGRHTAWMLERHQGARTADAQVKQDAEIAEMRRLLSGIARSLPAISRGRITIHQGLHLKRLTLLCPPARAIQEGAWILPIEAVTGELRRVRRRVMVGRAKRCQREKKISLRCSVTLRVTECRQSIIAKP